MSRNIKALLWDLDGTLIDSLKDVWLAVNHVLESLGLQRIDLHRCRRFIGDGVHLLLKRASMGSLEGRAISEAVDLFIAFYREHLLDNTVVFPGILNVLEDMEVNGIKMAVVTNKTHEIAVEICKRLRINTFMNDNVFGGGYYEEKKPSPIPLLKTAERLQVDPKETIVIGDGVQDIHASKAAGMITTAVTWGNTERERLASLSPEFIVETSEELLSLLRLTL